MMLPLLLAATIALSAAPHAVDIGTTKFYAKATPARN